MKSSSLAGALLLSALAGCGGGVDVTYRRTEGEVLTYVRTLDVQGANPSGVQGRVRQEVTTRETALEVRRREQATIQVDLQRLVMEVFRGEGKDPVLHMDTAIPGDPKAPAKEPETEAEKFAWTLGPLRQVAGCRVYVEQQVTGKILRFDGVEDLQKKVLASVPEGDARRPALERMPWTLWLANLLSPAIGTPGRGMSTGADLQFADMRTLPETTGTGGYMYYAGNYRLAKVEAGIARLEMESEVFLDPLKGMPPWPRAMAARRNFLRLEKGSCRAWARIGVETGVLEEDEHVTDLDLYFVKPDGKGEVAIPTKVTLRSRLVR